MEKFQLILILAYMALGYWAAKRTVFANKILYGKKLGDIFIQILVVGTVLGFILIPVALIKEFIRR